VRELIKTHTSNSIVDRYDYNVLIACHGSTSILTQRCRTFLKITAIDPEHHRQFTRRTRIDGSKDVEEQAVLALCSGERCGEKVIEIYYTVSRSCLLI